MNEADNDSTIIANETAHDTTQRAVAIIGAGLIGRGWAIVFARAGWPVKLYDLNVTALDAAREAIAAQLKMMVALELCANTDDILDKISYEADLETALQSVDYVQECGPEVLEAKQVLFSELDRLSSSNTILASSTSGFMTSEFAAHLKGRHRALVAHPVNPPHLVPLVEISPAQWTDPAITQTVHDIMTAVKQTPITVQKEIPGFILNRLQGALLNEALRLAQGGYATAEDIDKAVRDGLGLRWSFMGPLETIDLNAPAGIADYAQRYGPMYREMVETQGVAPDWDEQAIAVLDESRRKILDIDSINERQVWRDNRLAALIAHRSKQES